MAERSVQQNPVEAAELFTRGVGAAKGGQKRVAASLLARAVQLDPRHEQAWLWLSGVLEDPNEIAFCLRSVLSVNPHNERARQGLAWLEQRQLIAVQPAPPAVLPPTRSELVRSTHERDDHPRRAGWWVHWRQNRRDTSRAWQIVVAGLALLLLFTFGLNMWLREAIARTKGQNAALSITVLPGATAAPTVIPILQSRFATSEDALTLAYLSTLEAERARLQAAVGTYREATNMLGHSAVAHAGAARELRAVVDASYRVIAELRPPQLLQAAHDEYLEGLDQERSAMDDMLDFYGSFSVQMANRAVLRLEDASQRIERARFAFTLVQQQANSGGLPAQTLR